MAYNDPIGKANNGKPRPRRLAFLLSLFLWVLSYFPTLTYAQSDVNLQDIPTRLGEALGIPTFGAQIICSGIMMLMFLLPFTLLSRSKGRNSIYPEIAITLIMMGACIAIGWLPYWFLVILSVLIALSFAGVMRGWMTGRGK